MEGILLRFCKCAGKYVSNARRVAEGRVLATYVLGELLAMCYVNLYVYLTVTLSQDALQND